MWICLLVRRTWVSDLLDTFAIGAYGMEPITGEDGKITIRVKEGEDAAGLAKEALADGILPETCVLRVGEDGQRTYVCDPEPEPAPAG